MIRTNNRIASFITAYIIFFLFTALSSFAQGSYYDWKVKGDKAYDKAAYIDAISYYLKAFDISEADPGDAYNLACCYALVKQEQNAFQYLELAINNGWTNDAWMKKDSDLNYLHGFPEWEAVVSQTADKRKQLESALNAELRDELLAMQEIDQEARRTVIKLLESYDRSDLKVKEQIDKIRSIDHQQTARLKAIVESYGWPGKTLVGQEGANAAWLIAQHADRQPEFQAYCLQKMDKLLETGEVSRRDYAYLHDRVQCAKGEFQLYATQAIRDPESGELIFQPIEDESELDFRRASMNLIQTAAEYAEAMGFEYQPLSREEAEALHNSRISKYANEINSAKAELEKGGKAKAANHFKSALMLNGYINTGDLVTAGLLNAELGGEFLDDAFLYFSKAVARGFEDLNTIEKSAGFNNLANDDRWETLKSRF
ncbi:MAG: DUF6624 domain-containing protein [Bacteroidota bacterium]